MTPSPIHLHDLPRADLTALVASWGLSPVHAARLWAYLYLEDTDDIRAMSDLPARMRDRLLAETSAARLPVACETHSSDGFTRKYLLALSDGREIETVLMRYKGRVTACVSSQVGCAMGCVFCATGQMGFTRHLTAGEIVAQALHVDRVLRRTADDAPALAEPGNASPHHRHERLRNIVLMGMGEPLHNYDAVMRAINILRDGNGLALGARKITLSTVGVVPGIIRLADENNPVHLAVSLHGATQAERAALVPAARAWPLDALMEACRYYVQKQQRRIFFEWTLIEGKNDGPDQARAVGRLLRGMQAQVNLIPLNPTSGYAGEPGRADAAKRFQAVLAEHGLPSTIRQRRGIDIGAGCGQLATESRRG
ncbi:23S rRNA (adenine(2503)-C(2))-methyltransferase RlmN [Opitutaceae bacterium TAV4]|nr:23S rRNA (adenine(2503)-C(2))-methyltransferase RlmN [Opitutaceae bacterium TAV4]RRK00083.1 23S rRNA (adenine(2503)-C(2))-methyltransferase RlmN [Opitutaceae bacterium TAV3]